MKGQKDLIILKVVQFKHHWSVQLIPGIGILNRVLILLADMATYWPSVSPAGSSASQDPLPLYEHHMAGGVGTTPNRSPPLPSSLLHAEHIRDGPRSVEGPGYDQPANKGHGGSDE